MKTVLLTALFFAGSVHASDTYFKCTKDIGDGSTYTGIAASFSMSQGIGGFTIEGMDFLSQSAGGDGDIEKDKQGDVLTIINSTTLSGNPFVFTHDLSVKTKNGDVIKYHCQNLQEDAQPVQQYVAPVSGGSGKCDSYYAIAADGSQCGLRSHDSRERPY
jgi:hypothetical protein